MTGHVLPGKILIKRDEIEEKTAGGVILPTNLLEPPSKGTVLITGEGTDNAEMVITIGDKVFYADHAGTPVVLDEDDLNLKGEFVLLEQRHVLFIKRK